MTELPPVTPASAPPPAAAGRLRQACRDLEAVFMRQLVAGMRATVPEGGLLQGAPGDALYDSMLDTALAEALTDAGGVGLADLLYQQLYEPAIAQEPEPDR